MEVSVSKESEWGGASPATGPSSSPYFRSSWSLTSSETVVSPAHVSASR